MSSATSSTSDRTARTRLALGLLCALAAAPAADAKGAYGRVGHQRATGRGGTGPTISRGYTRSYFFMYLGTRHVCSACARNSESDSYGPTMRSAVVVAELDVEFPQDVDLSDGSAARLGAEPLVELRVAAMVMQSVPALSSDDVSVRDSWLAPPSCSGTADTPALACDLDPATDGSAACPAGCDYENSTVMYEVAIFTGELMPNDMDEASGQLRSYSRGSLVFNALRLCGDCGALGAASATLGDSRTCAAHEQQVLEWTKLAECCNATVFAHVANFSEPLAMAGAVRGAQINDCGNRTLEIVTLQSEVETFGDVVLHGEGGRMAEAIGLVACFVLLAAWCHCAAQHDARRLGLSNTNRGCGWCDRWDERRRASEAAARRKEITVAPAAPTPARQNAAAAGRKDAAPGPSTPARAPVAAKRAGGGAAARAAPARRQPQAQGPELFLDQADRFIQAAHSGQLADMQALYRRSHVGSALLESVNGKGGTTALMWAAANGHGDCVRALVDWGAAVDKVNSDGNTALHCAAKRGELQCVRLLAEGGADQALRNAQGKTALEVAQAALASLSPGEQLVKVGGVWSGGDLATSMSRALEQAFSPARQGLARDVEAGQEVAEPLMAVPVAEPLVPAAEAVAIPGQPLGGEHAQPEPTPAP